MALGKTKVYDSVRDGELHVTTPTESDSHMKVSYHELHEYMRWQGKPLWSVEDTPDSIYVGNAFRKYWKDKKYSCPPSVNKLGIWYPGFDGSVYIGPDALSMTNVDEVKRIAMDLFRYNQIMVRHRPFTHRRRIHLCYDDKNRAKVDEMARVINNSYPNTVITERFEYTLSTLRRSMDERV